MRWGSEVLSPSLIRNPPLTPPLSGRGEVDDGKGIHPLVVERRE